MGKAGQVFEKIYLIVILINDKTTSATSQVDLT